VLEFEGEDVIVLTTTGARTLPAPTSNARVAIYNSSGSSVTITSAANIGSGNTTSVALSDGESMVLLAVNDTGTWRWIQVGGEVSVSLNSYSNVTINGANLNLSSAAGGSGSANIVVSDNIADALSVKINGGADFLVFDSTDTNEKLTILSAVTQKLGFYGTTPVVQPAHADQAAATGGATQDAEARTLLNRIRADLVALGLIKGAA
jgi:hypothetical protein